MYLIDDVRSFLSQLNVYKILTSEETKERFLELYFYTFEVYPNCTGCANEIEQAIQKLMWIVNKNKTETHLKKATMLSKYTMKSRVRIYSNSLQMVVTQYNCTDAIAEALIAESPKNADLFIVNPEQINTTVETYSVSNPPDAITSVTIEDNQHFSEKKKRGRKKK